MMDRDGLCTNHEVSIACTSCEENERERIIQLLENVKGYPTGWNYDDPFESVIAMIKGEL